MISDLTEERNFLKQQLFECEDRMIEVEKSEEHIANLERKVIELEDFSDSLRNQLEALRESTQPNEKYYLVEEKLSEANKQTGRKTIIHIYNIYNLL